MNEITLTFKRNIFKKPSLVINGDQKTPYVLKCGLVVSVFRDKIEVFSQDGQGVNHFFNGRKITSSVTLLKRFPMNLDFSEVGTTRIKRIGTNTFGPIKFSFEIKNVEKASLVVSNKVFSREDKLTLTVVDLDEIERDIMVYLMMIVYFELNYQADIPI